MNKIKLICFTGILNAMIFSAYADDQSSGCGLGYQVFRKNSLLSSFARSLTNATFSNTIAMTFGTSGCAHHSIVQNEKLPIHFAEVNLPQIEFEMAQGQGQYLEAFALTLGCSESALPRFYEFSRNHFSEFMGNPVETPAERVEKIRNALKQDLSLRFECPGQISG
jgi:hypothetical protein